MTDRSGIFAGDDPFALAQRWLDEATATEPNDPNAIALATVDADGLPDVLVVSVLDLDATQRARERGLPDSALVRAPGISTQEWAIDPALSDSRGQWRPVSGDARWRVETWRHL